MNRPTFISASGAVVTLNHPLLFASAQADANRLLARCHPILCKRCEEDGKVPGKRKRCLCKRCHGLKRGYQFNQSLLWTGWPPTEKRTPKAV